MFAGGIASIAILGAPLEIRLVKADPAYYLSYALDYGDVAARFGQTYHGNRISYLFIDRVAFELFGPGAGYLAARWFALAIAVGVVHAIAAPRVGRTSALGLSAAVGLTPWLPVQLLWTHYDGFATVYLLLAVWFLVGGPSSRRRGLLAGVALALVVNSNLAYTVVVGTALVAYVFSATGPMRDRLRVLGPVAIGAALAEIALSVTVRLWVGSGPWFAEWVPIQTALFLAGDSTWFKPLSVAVSANPTLAVLPFIGTLSLVSARGRRSESGADAALLGGAWLIGSLVIILALHSFASVAWLTQTFFNIILLPPAVVALIGLMEKLRGADPESIPSVKPGRRRGALILTAWIGALGLLWSDGTLRPWAIGVVLLVLISIVPVLSVPFEAELRPRFRAAAVALVPVLLAASWSAPAQVPDLRGFADFGARERTEWTLFHAIVGVKELVAATVPVERDLAFWHRVEGPEGDWLRQINMAYYGGGTSRIHIDKGPDPYGMPEFRAEQLIAVRERSPISIVLLGLDRSEVTAGLVALSTAVPDATTVAMEVIEGDAFDLHVIVVEVD